MYGWHRLCACCIDSSCSCSSSSQRRHQLVWWEVQRGQERQYKDVDRWTWRRQGRRSLLEDMTVAWRQAATLWVATAEVLGGLSSGSLLKTTARQCTENWCRSPVWWNNKSRRWRWAAVRTWTPAQQHWWPPPLGHYHRPPTPVLRLPAGLICHLIVVQNTEFYWVCLQLMAELLRKLQKKDTGWQTMNVNKTWKRYIEIHDN